MTFALTMGGQNSKEEVVIAQNGAGNSASTEQLLTHASWTTYILLGICAILLVGGAILLIRYYRKSHTKWMRRNIELYDLRRTLSILRRQQRDTTAGPEAVPA